MKDTYGIILELLSENTKMTNLPCNITPSHDKIQLVLWYKVSSLETRID